MRTPALTAAAAAPVQPAVLTGSSALRILGGGAPLRRASTLSGGAAGAASPAERRTAVLAAVRAHATARSDAFYVVDLAEVARKLREWRAELPRVRPFYAVKCNDDPRIVAELAALGAGFDCASKGEMAMALRLGVPPSDIIFAHPAKQVSHLAYARAKGVTKMTFDNEDELRKIAREHPGAEAVLRILTDDSHSACRLGLKFGCPLDKVGGLVDLARELGVNLVGISYHVGSGNGHAQSFADAVRDARTAFDVAAAHGTQLRLLDIGGGFPGSDMGAEDGGDGRLVEEAGAQPAAQPSFKPIAGAVREALDRYFPDGCGVELMAEPGRFFVRSSHTLAVNVVARRKTVDDATGDVRYNYYVNDGLYGSFNCVLYDHATAVPKMVLRTGAAAEAADAVDDAIAKLRLDGTPEVADAVGLEHARELAAVVGDAALAAAAAAQEANQAALARRRMVVGGGDEADADGVTLRAAAGSAGPHHHAGHHGGLFAGAATAASAHALRLPSAGAPVRAASTAAAATAAAARTYTSTLWGPTCDSIDKITDTAQLPELHIGDWLVFENMGAYTIAGSCKFNGFPLSTKVYLHRDGSVEVQDEEVHE